MNIIHLITPGIDSVCTYFYILENMKYADLKLVHAMISPRYGAKEVVTLMGLKSYFTHDVDVIKFNNQLVKEEKDGFIASRNLLLASLVNASTFQDQKVQTTISFSFTKDDRVYDSDVEYCKAVSKVLNGHTDMLSYVGHLSKSELAKWFINDSNSLTKRDRTNLLYLTYSCYSGLDVECLSCNACFRKSVTLSELGLSVRKIDEDFLMSRLNILNEKVPEERKDNIRNYVRKLVDIGSVSKHFIKMIEPRDEP